MEADAEGCTLLWKQQTRRKVILHDPLTKTPIFRTAPGTRQYQAFEATYMACDASHLRNHIFLNLDHLRNAVDLDPVEFVAEEDLNRPEKESKGSEGAQEQDEEIQEDRIGPLTLSPAPNLTDHELLELNTSADDNQAKFMR